MMFFPLKSIANKTLTKPLGKDGTQKLYTVVTIDRLLAAIFFTSGTSGESKAVLLSHSGIVSVINSYLEIFKVPDTALSVLPYHHAFGLICGAIIVFSSANTVFINTDLKYFLSDIKDSSANVMAVVPAHLEFIQKRIENSIKLQLIKNFEQMPNLPVLANWVLIYTTLCLEQYTLNLGMTRKPLLLVVHQ